MEKFEAFSIKFNLKVGSPPTNKTKRTPFLYNILKNLSILDQISPLLCFLFNKITMFTVQLTFIC